MQALTSLLSEYRIIFTITHVLGVVVGMGAALMSDFLFSFYGHDKKLSHSETYTLGILSKIVWIGLLIITISGVGIFLTDIEGYSTSTKFLVKMTILAVLLVNGYILHRYISRSMIKKGFLSFHKFIWLRKIAFACGAISVVSWLSLLTLGVLHRIDLSYITLLGIYLVILAVSILIALVIEEIELENK